MFENADEGRRLRPMNFEAGARDVVHERRRGHDRIVFERERRDGNLAGRQPQEIVEARACGREPVGVGRPSELAQQPRGIEDAGIRPLRPVGFDEADDPHGVELGVGRRSSVEQPDAARAGPRRERLSFNPPPHRCPELGCRQRPVVVPGMRVSQGSERADDGGTRAPLPLSGSRFCRLLPLAGRDELEHRADLGRRTAGAADALEDRTELQRSTHPAFRSSPQRRLP